MIRFFILLLISIAFIPSAFAKQNDLIAQIKQQGCIKVAVYGKDFKPFIQWQNGQPSGFTIWLTKQLSEELGYKVCLIHSADTFDELIRQVASGKANIALTALTPSVTRSRLVNFSKPYLVHKTWLAVNRLKFARLSDADILNKIKNDTKLTVATLDKPFDRLFFKHYDINATAIPAKNEKDKLELVAQGDADATVVNQFTGKYWLKKYPALILNVRLIALPKLESGFSMAIPYNEQRLENLVNTFIAKSNQDKWIRQLDIEIAKDQYEQSN